MHPSSGRGGKPARTGAPRRASTGGASFNRNRKPDTENHGGAFRASGPRPSFGRKIHVPGEAPSAPARTSSTYSRTGSSASTRPSYRGSSSTSTPRISGGFRGTSSSGTGSRFSAPRPGRSFGGPPSRGGFGNRGGGGGRGGGRGRGERIDHSRFIKKAEHIEEVPYVSKHKFADFALPLKLKENITKKGYVHPTPIQDQAIPVALAGKDIFGLANTGTGKTAAFLLPLIDKIFKDRKEQVIVLAPTRELAVQIEKELIGFSYGMSIFSACCVGGMPIGRQVTTIKRGVSFIIGTPGRVKDLMDRKVINLSTFKSIVLDEADRMLDMGFRDEMEYVMNKMAPGRQTLFFSATMSPDIKRLSEKFLKAPEFISVVARETSKNIDQDVVRVIDRDKKIEQLHDILIAEKDQKVLIFRETKRDVDRLERELIGRGFKVGAIHGDKRNSQRVRTLEDFKRGMLHILIATDVAARGLDIPNVTHVINYDVPQTFDTYIHRIGRTGRAGKKGKALTFV